jgi:hypothetical protein
MVGWKCAHKSPVRWPGPCIGLTEMRRKWVKEFAPLVSLGLKYLWGAIFNFPKQLSVWQILFLSAQITSKVWGTFHKNRVEECLDQSLANLGIDYLDRKFNWRFWGQEFEALTQYISVSHSLACRAQSEWKPSHYTNVSGWKARRPPRLEIAGHLETDGGSFKKGSVNSFFDTASYHGFCSNYI